MPFQPDSQVYQIPPPPQPFIGREQERKDLFQSMLAGDVRLICGMGGIGKTALALRVAKDLADAGKFEDGILWIPLESNPAPETVAVWILTAFGVEAKANPLIQMAQLLNQYCPLLILDNAEAAIETADTILQNRGKAAALVTSRDVKVGIDAVPCLPDDLAPLENTAAVELLHSLMKQVTLDDTQAGELNTLVGGLPLALVLAAGFITRTLRRDPHPIATYLDLLRRNPLTALALGDRRERSVQIAFDLSWDRLNQAEQRAMMTLATIPGESADLQALTAALEMEPQSLQSILWILGNYSVVIQNGERWRLHPLLKLYTNDKTPTLEAILLRERLEQYYLDYVVQGNEKNRYGEHLDTERDNILGSIVWAWEMQDWRKVIVFAETINFYLLLRGYSVECLKYATWQLDASCKLQDDWEEANALHSLGAINLRLAKYTIARDQFDKSLQIFRAIKDRLGEANTLKSLGDVHYRLAEYSTAQKLHEEALPIHRDIGDRLGEANALSNLGNVYRMLAQYKSAKEKYNEALKIFQALNDRLGEAKTLRRLGNVHYILAEYPLARKKYEEALQITKAISDRLGEANALRRLGNVNYMLAEYPAAQERYEKALLIYRIIGDQLGEANTIHNFGKICLKQKKITEAKNLLTTALSLYQTINERVGIADSLRELGNVAYCQQQWDDAAHLYTQSLNICCEIGERYGEADCIAMQGRLAAAQGHNESARQLFNEALVTFQEIGLKKEVAEVQGWLAELPDEEKF